MCESGRKNALRAKNKANICITTVQPPEVLYCLENLLWLQDNWFGKEDVLKPFYEASAKTFTFSLSYCTCGWPGSSFHNISTNCLDRLVILHEERSKCQMQAITCKLFGGGTLVGWRNIEWWEIMTTHNLTIPPPWLQDVAQFDMISNDQTFPEKDQLPLSLLNWEYGSGNG